MRNNKGFTLIEIICSVALLAIIVTASASFFKSAAMSQRGSKEQLYANNMAQEILEKVTRTGKLSEFDKHTYTKDGIDYYIEVSATAKPDIVGSGSGSGGGADEDGNDTVVKDITFEVGTLPPAGTTVPGKPAKPGELIEGKPGSYNLRIMVFDFIDEDLPMLITAGKILGGSGSEYYNESQIFDILNKAPEFAVYNTKTPSAGGIATNIKKAATCFKNMRRSDITELTNTQFIASTGLGGWGHVKEAFNTQIPGPQAFSNNMWLMTSTSDAEKAALAQRMYDYLTCGDPVNLYSTADGSNAAARITYVCEYFKNNIDGKYSGKQVITGTGIPFFDGLEYETLTTNILKNGWGGNSLTGNVGNVYEILNRAEIASNHQGPCLLGKVFTDEDVCDAYDVAWSTKLWDQATVSFQVEPRQVACSTFPKIFTSWGSSPSYTQEYMDENHWGFKVKDLNTGYGYYQQNIIDEGKFYIDGGLSYRDLTVRGYMGVVGSGTVPDYAYRDVDADDGVHRPNLYYFVNLDYTSEDASMVLDIAGDPNWAANPNDDLGDDYQPPKYTGGEPGEEGSTGTNRHNVRDEDVVTPLSFSVKGMECYSIKVRKGTSTGAVLAELVAYGIPAKPTPTPDI